MVDPFPKPKRRDTLTPLNGTTQYAHQVEETMKARMEYGNWVRAALTWPYIPSSQETG